MGWRQSRRRHPSYPADGDDRPVSEYLAPLSLLLRDDDCRYRRSLPVEYRAAPKLDSTIPDRVRPLRSSLRARDHSRQVPEPADTPETPPCPKRFALQNHAASSSPFLCTSHGQILIPCRMRILF